MKSNKKLAKSVKAVKKEIKQVVKQTAKAKPKKLKTQTTRLGGLIKSAANFGEKSFGMRGLSQLGSSISRAFGQGDYTVTAGNSMDVVPRFGNESTGFRMRHREYVKDYKSTPGFGFDRLDINPGNTQLFPWLGNIAPRFEQYKIHSLIFCMKTTSATAVSSTNTALGVVGMVINYDPSEINFSTKRECENYDGCVSTVPFRSILCGFEAKKKLQPNNLYFVRSGPLENPEDLKFYDVGYLQTFSEGSQAEATVGELWVTYDIEFFRPKIDEENDEMRTSVFDNMVSSGTFNVSNEISYPTSGDLDCICYGNTVILPLDNAVRYY